MSTLGAFVVKIGGVDLDDPVPVDQAFVVTVRTIKRCLVGWLMLGVVTGRSHNINTVQTGISVRMWGS